MGFKIFTFFVALCAQTVVLAYSPLNLGKNDKCESLTYDICRKMDYNRTIFPNYLGHRKQSEAVMMVNNLTPLLKIRCSPDTLTFLCAVYFPMCTSINKIIPPCRSLCEGVHKGCSGILKRFGYVWPNDLSCDQFPVLKTDICVFHNKTGTPLVKDTSPTPTQTPTRKPTKNTKVTRTRKPVTKYCPASKVKTGKWNSKTQKDCCKCCMRGNRAGRNKSFKCTLNKSYKAKSFLKTFQKTLKECPSRKSKRCYMECCRAKKASTRKGSRRYRIKRPLGKKG